MEPEEKAKRFCSSTQYFYSRTWKPLMWPRPEKVLHIIPIGWCDSKILLDDITKRRDPTFLIASPFNHKAGCEDGRMGVGQSGRGT